MSEQVITNEIGKKLFSYHRSLNKNIELLDYFSPIAGDAFPGDFNVSGYHNEIAKLSENPRSFWGIDRCIRVQEKIDDVHSHVFHMGIFATGLDLGGELTDPFFDKRFLDLQAEVLAQCLNVLQSFGLHLNKLEATFLDGVTFGGAGAKGRDKMLQKQYTFPKDATSQNVLKEHKLTTFGVSSLTNMDIHPVEGALVGPRVEIAANGIEVATMVFDCFRLEDGKLVPINYVAGYAIGIERLETVLAGKTRLIDIVQRYKVGFDVLRDISPHLGSSLFHQEALAILFGAEALIVIDDGYDSSDSRKDAARQLRQNIRFACDVTGISDTQLNNLREHYAENQVTYNRG